MHFVAVVVSVSTLIARICSAGLIIETSKLDKSLVEASINILESCYTDCSSTVGLAGPSVESIAAKTSLRDPVIPVTLIDDTPRVVTQAPVNLATRYKLQVFVVTVTDPSTLVRTLTRVKSSKWWNHMASYLLIDGTEVGNGCSNAYEVLWEAWMMNLLKSKFLCFKQTRRRFIYTFNPYTSKAPAPWKKENTYKGINGHIWTLFAREYREDDSGCDTLDFDKTLDLGGYELRASVQGMENSWEASLDTKQDLLTRAIKIAAQILMSSVNATWKVLLHPETGHHLQDKDGNPLGMAAEIHNGSSDVCFNVFVHHSWVEYETTYGHFYGRMTVITQYPGHKSQLEKLISVLDKSSRFGVCVVFVITLFFFKFWVRKPLTPAILELVLMLCNTGFQTIPQKTAPRIYLAGLFIFVVTIQGIYSGQLASLLTKQVRLPVVNSIEDLVRSHHTIYGRDAYQILFIHPAFKGRYVGTDLGNCTSFVLRDPKAACVNAEFRIIDDAVNLKLHLSHESIGSFPGIYLIRPDWPLEDRVNEIYSWATAADLIKVGLATALNSEMRSLESYENEDKDQTFRVLTLGDLGFAFVILAIGLGFATITFAIEVITSGKLVANPRSGTRGRFRFIEWVTNSLTLTSVSPRQNQ